MQHATIATCNIIKGSFIYLFFVVNPSINSSLNLSITRSRNSTHVLLCCKAKTNRSVYQRLKKPGIGNMFFPLLLPLFAFLASVSGHGGVLWPPTWQAGVATPIEEIRNSIVFSTPKSRDPNTGYWITSPRAWLSDQSYTGGYGDEFRWSCQQTFAKFQSACLGLVKSA